MNLLLKRAVQIITIIVLAAIIALVYRMNIGVKIKHFKQYFIPCEGRIVCYPNAATTISLKFIDEAEISEISDKNNIKIIKLITSSGEKIVINDYTLSNLQDTPTEIKFFNKVLDITFETEKTITINKIEATYPDSIEEYGIGSLEIYPLQYNKYNGNTQIFSNISGKQQNTILISEETPYINMANNLTYVNLNANCLESEYSIIGVDTGLKGLEVDSEFVKHIPVDFDFGQKFTENVEYAAYNKKKIVTKFINKDMEIKIKATSPLNDSIIIALKRSEEFGKKLDSYYFSPIFTCRDNTSGKTYLYGNPNYMLISSIIKDSKIAAKLLKEDGE